MKGRILVINTGSTSSKIGFYDSGEKLFEKKEEMLKFHNSSLCLALMICARSGTKKEKLPIGSFSKLYGSYWINKLVF